MCAAYFRLKYVPELRNECTSVIMPLRSAACFTNTSRHDLDVSFQVAAAARLKSRQ